MNNLLGKRYIIEGRKMKTNVHYTRLAFLEMHKAYFAHRTDAEKIDELMMIFENNDGRYYNNFMASRRTKAHSAAFYSVQLALKSFLPEGYYATSSQIKANILIFWGELYMDFLKPLTEMIEAKRNQILAERSGDAK